jgi:hypothetical protein
MEYLVNQTLNIAFTSDNLVTGLTSFSPVFLVDGAVFPTPSITFTEVGDGLYFATFAPGGSGKWAMFVEGRIQATFEVVSKTLQTALQDLTDESLGSWTWNKATGLLTLFRSDSSTLATYTVLDTVDAASRERLT